jgi:hypothetical protein
MTSLEERVAVLEARAQISELRARYAWLAARGRFDLVADELFTDDLVFEVSRGPGERMRVEGRQTFKDTIGAQTGSRAIEVVPVIANETIQVAGDDAWGTCLMHSPVAPGPVGLLCGYYHDRLRRVDGCWRFSERLYYFYVPFFDDAGREQYEGHS